MVGLKEPRAIGMGCACHPGHVLQCPESNATHILKFRLMRCVNLYEMNLAGIVEDKELT